MAQKYRFEFFLLREQLGIAFTLFVALDGEGGSFLIESLLALAEHDLALVRESTQQRQ